MREKIKIPLGIAIIIIITIIIGFTVLSNNQTTPNTNNITINNTTTKNSTINNTDNFQKNIRTNNHQNINSGDEYHYSGQYDQYIKEYTDSNGVQHIEGKSGWDESYDPKTGKSYFNGKEGAYYEETYF
ncbi:MAG: hypothetical protein Q4Q23_04850 [Methanobacteriaceae archaeon]|nr:hypothetical protein [Methanobacteriaceae archaeon]